MKTLPIEHLETKSKILSKYDPMMAHLTNVRSHWGQLADGNNREDHDGHRPKKHTTQEKLYNWNSKTKCSKGKILKNTYKNEVSKGQIAGLLMARLQTARANSKSPQCSTKIATKQYTHNMERRKEVGSGNSSYQGEGANDEDMIGKSSTNRKSSFKE